MSQTHSYLKCNDLMTVLRKCVPRKVDMDEMVNHEADRFSDGRPKTLNIKDTFECEAGKHVCGLRFTSANLL